MTPKEKCGAQEMKSVHRLPQKRSNDRLCLRLAPGTGQLVKVLLNHDRRALLGHYPMIIRRTAEMFTELPYECT